MKNRDPVMSSTKQITGMRGVYLVAAEAQFERFNGGGGWQFSSKIYPALDERAIQFGLVSEPLLVVVVL